MHAYTPKTHEHNTHTHTHKFLKIKEKTQQKYEAERRRNGTGQWRRVGGRGVCLQSLAALNLRTAEPRPRPEAMVRVVATAEGS